MLSCRLVRTCCQTLNRSTRFFSFTRILANRQRVTIRKHDIAKMVAAASSGIQGDYSIVSGTSWSIDLMPTEFPNSQLTSGEIGEYKTDLLVLGLHAESFEVTKEGDEETVRCISEDLLSKDEILKGALTDIIEKGDFKAEVGQSSFVRVGGDIKNVGLFGLGKKAEVSTAPGWGYSPFYKLGTQLATTAKTMKIKSVSIDLESLAPELSTEATAQIISGILLGAYESTRYKESAKKSSLSNICLVNFPDGVQKGIEKGYAVARGVGLTTYLVESPPNVCYPQHLADAAAMISEKFPSVYKLKILEKADCEKLKMGLYLGVANASTAPPKFIHLTYSKGTPKRDVALIGKGITFDSGGYNLKAGAGSSIELMKMDMGGAGAVLGASHIVGELAPDDIRIHFIVASCENMVSGEGYRPGDIISASNGKSVEVINTDAEGRLTLADALLYAQNECKATSIINIATLTGAIVVALGRKIGGFFSPSEAIANELTEASKRSGEKVWRLPLEEEYNEELTKGIADLKNVGSRFGGAITAALFLKHFVKTEEVEWAHIDMSGPAKTEKGEPTGFGANLLAEWAIEKSKANE